MKKIILVSGKARSGKNTVTDYMKKKLVNQENKVIEDMYAKYIKGYLKDYYEWDGITKNHEVRQKLQQLGTEIIKENLNYKCFHAKRLAEDFQIVQYDFDYFLVSDARFEDEIYIMKAMFPNKVISLRIERDEEFTGGLTKEHLQHKSETGLDNFDFNKVICNTGTLDDLFDKVDLFMKEYKLL